MPTKLFPTDYLPLFIYLKLCGIKPEKIDFRTDGKALFFYQRSPRFLELQKKLFERKAQIDPLAYHESLILEKRLLDEQRLDWNLKRGAE